MPFLPVFRDFMKKYDTIFLFLTLILLSVFSVQAQSVKRVVFAKGSKTAVFNDSARIGEKDTYVVKLRKGQKIDISPDWVNGAGISVNNEDAVSGFMVITPKGEKIEDPQDTYFIAELSGDYTVVVRPVYKRKSYRYKLTFTLQ